MWECVCGDSFRLTGDPNAGELVQREEMEKKGLRMKAFLGGVWIDLVRYLYFAVAFDCVLIAGAALP